MKIREFTFILISLATHNDESKYKNLELLSPSHIFLYFNYQSVSRVFKNKKIEIIP